MNFLYIYSFLSFISLTLLLLSFFHVSTINLLLNIVFILFFQSVNGLLLGINIFSLYLIIIYLGAIVILFSFMVLFINILESSFSPFLKKIGFITLSFLIFHLNLVLWLKWNKEGYEIISLSSNIEKINSNYESPAISSISYNLYNEYFYAGLICISLMSLGLFLILIFKIFNYDK